MNNKIRRNKRNNHIELGAKMMVKDENVLSIFEGLKQWVLNIYLPNQQLFNIYTGIPASKELINNAKPLKSRGKDCRGIFFKKIVKFKNEVFSEQQEKNYFDHITKQPLITFADKVKKADHISLPEDEGQTFAIILNAH